MKHWLIAFALLVLAAFPAAATTCPSYTYTFSSNTTIFSAQANANFNTIMNCANTLLAPLASPMFTGVPISPTAAPGTNTTQIATTAFVQAAAGAQGANPTATAATTPVNGSATTYMRSDGAPALPVATNLVPGVIRTDGSTVVMSGSILSAQATVVAGVTCTPGGSCAPLAASMGNGASGTGAIVLASGASISGATITAGTIDAGNSFTNIGNNAGVATACWSSTSSTAVLEHVASSTCVASDERLKANWSYDVPGLHLIEQLKPGFFDWRDQTEAQAGRQLGLKAQDVQKLLPQIVIKGGDQEIVEQDGSTHTVEGVLNLDYAKLTVPLIIAVQQQQREIRGLMGGMLLLVGFVAWREYARRRIAK